MLQAVLFDYGRPSKLLAVKKITKRPQFVKTHTHTHTSLLKVFSEFKCGFAIPE